MATLAVVAFPLAAVSLIEVDGVLGSPVVSVLIAVALSYAASSAGSAYWKRRPGSRDLVFGDLMLWGFIRRLRAERRLSRAAELLGDSERRRGLSREARVELLERLGASLEARDAHTHGHSRRVTRHAEAIARRLGLPREQIAMVRTAAAVHDVGKVRTPRWILTKPERLSGGEFELLKRHATNGAAMVAGLGDEDVAAVVRHHHERLDGFGYPDGLKGDDIPLGARIVAVADIFDAMTSTRPHSGGHSHKQALDKLTKEAGVKFDADAVAAFVAYYSGNRGAAWSAFGVAAPQRALAWLLDAGAGPVTKGIAAVGAIGLMGSSLAGPDAATLVGERAQSGPVPAATAQVPQRDSAAATGGGDRARAGQRETAVQRRAAMRLDSGSRIGAPPRVPLRSPAGAGVKGMSAEPAGGGEGRPPAAEAIPPVVPSEITVPGARTPAAKVEVDLPQGRTEVRAPSVEVPGVRVPLPELPAVGLRGS